MAYWYVKGATGASGNAGTSWTAAKQSVAQALAIATFASGDIILVDRNETFTATAAISWTPLNATILNVAIISVEPSGTTGFIPTAGATETVGTFSGKFSIVPVQGIGMYVWGMRILGSSAGAIGASIDLFNTPGMSAFLTLDNCVVDLRSTIATSIIQVGSTSSTTARSLNVRIVNSEIVVSASRAGTMLILGEGNLELINTTMHADGVTKPAATFGALSPTDISRLTVRDCSLELAPGALFLLTNMASLTALVKNCKLNAAGSVSTGTWPGGSGSITVRNCYPLGIGLGAFVFLNAYGFVTATADVTLDGGAEFGSDPVSWQVSTTALANEFLPFELPTLEIWTETVGAQTATIEFVRTSATPLTDREIWSDIDYPQTADLGQYTYHDNRNNAPYTGTPVAQPVSIATWTGSLGGTPSKQKLTHAITTAEPGLLQARVSVGKASEVFYLNPVITGIT